MKGFGRGLRILIGRGFKEPTNMKLNSNAFAFSDTRVVGRALSASLLALVSLALTPRTMQAQDLVLDNFATGPGQVNAVAPGTYSASQTGSGIVGGTATRYITVGMNPGNNPYLTPVQAQVLPSTTESVPSAFLWSNGFGALSATQIVYEGSGNSALGLNLSAYTQLRVTFAALSGGLNFNIVAYQGSNGEATGVGCNLLNPYYGSFSVDFPFSEFTLNGQEIDWSNISALVIEFQPAGASADATGSPNLAVTQFLAMNSKTSAIGSSTPTITCNGQGSRF
jgi:hypothetical protein